MSSNSSSASTPCPLDFGARANDDQTKRPTLNSTAQFSGQRLCPQLRYPHFLWDSDLLDLKVVWNITTRFEFESKVSPAALSNIVSSCNQSLENNSPCATCTTSLSSLASYLTGPSVGNVFDCAAYPSIYAAAFANHFGPTDEGTAKCLFLLDITAASSGKGKKNVVIIVVVVVCVLVLHCCALVIGFCGGRGRLDWPTSGILGDLREGMGTSAKGVGPGIEVALKRPSRSYEKYIGGCSLFPSTIVCGRPTMDQANMLDADIPVPTIPERPISLIADLDDIERSVSSSGGSGGTSYRAGGIWYTNFGFSCGMQWRSQESDFSATTIMMDGAQFMSRTASSLFLAYVLTPMVDCMIHFTLTSCRQVIFAKDFNVLLFLI
ncbi:hypothetical protein HAX54_010076 [Datura stramonium]|uniref:SPARK domain-containing protein n=1 Tax=Datura stramonium TaxID=4076 RepID=A0ABS8RWV4_DATST|nr:hypothetical protein [Datura stramonium]